jgi:hypothetical protein
MWATSTAVLYVHSLQGLASYTGYLPSWRQQSSALTGKKTSLGFGFAFLKHHSISTTIIRTIDYLTHLHHIPHNIASYQESYSKKNAVGGCQKHSLLLCYPSPIKAVSVEDSL